MTACARRGRHAVALAALAALAGCAPAPSDDPWFPLAAGREWTYRVTTERDDADPAVETLSIAARGPDDLPGTDRAPRRHASSGIDYWLRADASGVYRVATRGVLEREPRRDEEPQYVLLRPYAVGTEWRGTTTSYVLLRRNEVPRDVARLFPSIPTSWRIEATDAAVDTPAGRFAPCLRVHGQAQVKLWVDEVRTYRDVPLLTNEWYCRDVGLVKVERVEASPSKFYVGGRVVLELTRWR